MAEIQWGLLNGVVPSFGEQLGAYQAGENTVQQRQQLVDQQLQRGMQERRLQQQDRRLDIQDGRQTAADERQKELAQWKVLHDLGSDYKGMTPEQVGQAFDAQTPHLATLLEAGPEELAQIRQVAVSGALPGAAKHIEMKLFNTSKGVVGVNEETGESKLLYDAPIDPLDRELKEARIHKMNRGPAPHAAAAPKLPSGFILD